MAAHRYWRIRGIAFNGNPMAAAEVEMRTVIGGSTVCTGGAAISSGDYGGGYQKENAFNGNTTDQWAANSADSNTYIGYDFGAGNEKDIVEVAYRARTGGESVQTPNSALLEYSDDAATWTISFGILFGTFTSNQEKVRSAIAAPPAGSNPHKFWRINFLTDTGLSSGREGELHLYPGDPDITETQVVLFSDVGHYSNWDFSRMFDGNLDALTAIAAAPSWAQAEFLSPVTLEEFVWRARNGGGANYQTPMTGNVAYSDDGAAFTVAWTWDAGGHWNDDETKTFTNPDAGSPGAPRRRAAIVVC